jgi:hypothetical protein
MEKHSAYCALMRLGMKVPDTVLVPYKNPVDNVRWAYTSEQYNDPFELGQIAQGMGYPLFMMLMHLQKSVEPYDVFARALTIGPETMVMHFRPYEPMHNRYAVSHGFLSEQVGSEAVTIAQTVNAFFRWEFNSCEMLVQGDEVLPIDYANACPDVAVTSLHYYFPWAMRALVKWSAYCAATGRTPRLHVEPSTWFKIADDESLDYADKLVAYQKLADEYFERDAYEEFCAKSLPHIDEQVFDWVSSPDFDQLLLDTVVSTYPAHEVDQFLAHFRGLLDLWKNDQNAAPA